MKAILFDLDDTLYPEIAFVKSGFRVVASYLQEITGKSEEYIFERLNTILKEQGRGKIFNTILQELDLFSDMRVKLLVYLYRSHYPDINLFEGVVTMINTIRSIGIKVGIITDGIASVQHNKIRALCLEEICDLIICTDDIGIDCWKPSPIPFRIALDLLNVSPKDALYVGDNVQKDFLAPNSLGWCTMLVRLAGIRDHISEVSSGPLFEPCFTVDSLKVIINIVNEI